jgi:hypothetical protein
METLPPVNLGVTILLPFALMLVLHQRAEAIFVLNTRRIEQPRRQFILEISLPIVAGIITAIANLIIREFPLGSGLTLPFSTIRPGIRGCTYPETAWHWVLLKSSISTKAVVRACAREVSW